MVMFKYPTYDGHTLSFFDSSDVDKYMYMALAELGLTAEWGCGLTLMDVFIEERTGPHRESVHLSVPVHDCRMFLAGMTRL